MERIIEPLEKLRGLQIIFSIGGYLCAEKIPGRQKVLCQTQRALAAVVGVGEDGPGCHDDQRRSPGGGRNTPAFQRARQSPQLRAIPGSGVSSTKHKETTEPALGN